MRLPIKSYQKAWLLLLSGLLSLSIGIKKTYAVARRFSRMKHLLPHKGYLKSHPYGWATGPANPAAAFTTPSFHDFSPKERARALDLKKINFAMGPPQTPFFVGRATAMATLAPYFDSADKLVILPPITGFDGVGKTQLALQLAHQHGAQYDYIVWINAATTQDIEESYREIAKDLGIRVAFDEEIKEVIRLVQEKLKDRRVLYIFDNAPNLNTIQHYFSGGHILITSRNSATMDWKSPHYNVPLALQPFSEEEALQLAKAMGQKHEDPDLINLIQLLPTYPLVLKLLFSSMSAHQYTPQSFLQEIGQHHQLIKQLKENPEAYTTYQNTLSYIVESTLETLRSSENGNKPLHLVQQMACLDTHPIPLSFVLLALAHEEEIVHTRTILSTLEKHGLLTWDGYNIHMHGVIQTIVGELYPLTPAQVGTLVDGYFGYNIDKVAAASYPTADFYHQMIPHGEKLLTYVKKQPVDDPYEAKCYFQLSHLYREHGDYQKAIALGEEAVDLFFPYID